MFNKDKVVNTILNSAREGFAINIKQNTVTIGTREDAQFIKLCLETGYIPENVMRREMHLALWYAIHHTVASSEEGDKIVSLLNFDDVMLDLLNMVMKQMKEGTAFHGYREE